jgi:hypothetical protein
MTLPSDSYLDCISNKIYRDLDPNKSDQDTREGRQDLSKATTSRMALGSSCCHYCCLTTVERPTVDKGLLPFLLVSVPSTILNSSKQQATTYIIP